MEYSVESLSKVSKISVRTLHYYDQIGLLKPMARMQSGRRLYGTEQFLRLQEILYFKELGLSLKKIKLILSLKNMDRTAILLMQKELLQKEVNRFQKLLLSIDKTINHYKGVTMSHQDICNQFDHFNTDLKAFEDLADRKFGPNYMQDVKNKVAQMEPEVVRTYNKKSVANFHQLVAALKNGLTPTSEEVQNLMQEQVNLYNAFSITEPYTKESYEKAREMILEGPDFYSRHHPDLISFICEAMRIFSSKHFGV